MTIKELKEHCVRQIAEFERIKEIMPVTPNGYKRYEEHKIVLQLIEAWEKVKEEIEAALKYHEEFYNNNLSYRYGMEATLEIIDKHLPELAGDTDEYSTFE